MGHEAAYDRKRVIIANIFFFIWFGLISFQKLSLLYANLRNNVTACRIEFFSFRVEHNIIAKILISVISLIVSLLFSMKTRERQKNNTLK